MAFIGILLVVIGVSIAWLLGASGLQPADAITHVRQVLGIQQTSTSNGSKTGKSQG